MNRETILNILTIGIFFIIFGVGLWLASDSPHFEIALLFHVLILLIFLATFIVYWMQRREEKKKKNE